MYHNWNLSRGCHGVQSTNSTLAARWPARTTPSYAKASSDCLAVVCRCAITFDLAVALVETA
jgi:hypothetical protein